MVHLRLEKPSTNLSWFSPAFKCKHQIRELYKAGSLAERLAHDENQGTLVRMLRSAAALACDPLGGVAEALLRLTV